MDMFANTLKALEKGASHIPTAAAIKTIEYWEGKLEGVDVAGVKSIHRDLGVLKKELSSDQPDKAHVKAIVARLADETMKVAKRVDGSDSQGIEKIAEALDA